jgi:hypothetical protein
VEFTRPNSSAQVGGRGRDKRAAHLRTTTIGDSVFVISPRPFQIMNPDARTEAKLRI